MRNSSRNLHVTLFGCLLKLFCFSTVIVFLATFMANKDEYIIANCTNYNKFCGFASYTRQFACRYQILFALSLKVKLKLNQITGMPVTSTGVYPHMPIPLGCIASGG